MVKCGCGCENGFLDETNFGICRLSSPMWQVGLISSMEGLNRTKRQSEGGFTLSVCLQAEISAFSYLQTRTQGRIYTISTPESPAADMGTSQPP